MKRHSNNYAWIILILLLTFSTSLFSQNTKKVVPDSRLYQCFEKTYVDNLFKNNPEKIAYYNYYLDHSYYVVKINRPGEKAVIGTDIHTVDIKTPDGKISFMKFKEKSFNAKTFNVLKYNFNNDGMNYPTYVWNEMGIALVLYPEQYIKDEFKKLEGTK